MIWSKKPKEEIEFPQSIVVGDAQYLISVIFSKKKSSSVSIKENKLVFRLSSYLSANKAQQHFKQLLEKVVKKIEKTPQRFMGEKTIEDVLENGGFYFAQEFYKLEYAKSRAIKLIDNIFYVNPDSSKENIDKAIKKLLCRKYEHRLYDYVKELNKETYNYTIKGFSLKCVNSKWGHCSHDNKIMLNLKLLNADREIMDYVIFHEISHIKHKNHSKGFWDEVERFCLNYSEMRKRLKINPPQIYDIR